MYYTIRHVTRFRYSAPVSESVMEVRMQPLSEGGQRCLSFQLHTAPRAQVRSYTDYLGNTVHHFDVPGRHSLLALTAEAQVEVQPPRGLPPALGAGAWEQLAAVINEDHTVWEMLQPSHFARPGAALRALEAELDLGPQRDDPLALALALSGAVYRSFAYAPQSTRVDSPIEEALAARRGVCQDFAHITIALARGMGLPCRYVSGYLFHRHEDHDRSEADATHAWVEVLLPELGWVGLDPTNNLVAGERHVRTAVGRDYADVPPSRGVYKGGATSELHVAVRVAPSEAPPPRAAVAEIDEGGADWAAAIDADAAEQQQQQQQQ